jgi:epoxyqueuosine reductase
VDASGTIEAAAALKVRLKAEALALGFAAFGVTDASPAAGAGRLAEWLAAGRHAGMEWMAKDVERRTNPALILPGCKSVILVALNYFQEAPARRGRIATYALGGDYHKLIVSRLKKLCEILREAGAVSRPYADTGPILERELAERAGLGWRGRHTCLVHPILGSWTLLGAIATTLELPPDAPSENRCGTCSRCLKKCPTGALSTEGYVDARLCLSYLTIEHKGPIPVELREGMGDHLFGCDDCIGACPWNRRRIVTTEPRFTPRPLPDLCEILGWTREEFEVATAGSAIRRAGFEGLRRNACVVLGNIGSLSDLPALEKAAEGGSALVAEHAAWAVTRIRERCGKGTDEAAPEDAVPLPIDGVLDLHTFRPGEVKSLLAEYVASCREKGIFEIRIIHGKGTGTLRETVHGLLSRMALVESFTGAPEEEGGWGATVAHLSRKL